MGNPFGGSVWQDRGAWASLCTPDGCPICTGGKPDDVIVELPASWVTGPEVAPLPGYVAVVSKRHVVEPFELPVPERTAFWEDAMVAAKALAQAFRPIKVNYEIHGNTVPHLHMHLYPRAPGDPFVGGPINPRSALFRRSAADLGRIRDAILAARHADSRRAHLE